MSLLLCLILVVPFTFCAGEVSTTPDVDAKLTNSSFWAVREGDVCNLGRFPLPSEDTGKFYECITPTDNSSNWIWAGIGVWTKRSCAGGFQFDPIRLTCRTEKSIRRMQQTCGATPSAPYCGGYQQSQTLGYQIQIQPVYQQQQQIVQPVVQPQPCNPQVNVGCQQPQPIVQPYVQPVAPIVQPVVVQPNQVQNCGCPQPVYPQQPCGCPQPIQPVVQPQPCPNAPASNVGSAGQQCSWMLVGLAADVNPCSYLQCIPNLGPSQPNQFCGIWITRPCAPGTKFDVTAQVCVMDPNRQCGGAVPSCPCQPIQPTQPYVPPQPCPCQPVQPYIQPQPQPVPQPIPQPVCGQNTYAIGPCNIQQPSCPSCQTAPTCPGQSTCYGIAGAPQSNTCCGSIMG